VRQHLFSEAVFPVWPQFELVELEPDKTYPIAGVNVSHQSLPSHPGGSRAFRVHWQHGGQERSLAYVTDTTVDGSYTEFIRGVDLLIHECNFPDSLAEWSEKTGHSHTSMVGRLAKESSVIRLALTHVDPMFPLDDPLGIETARQIFPATELAEDGAVLSVD
jgi:ribonuclease BN (tRNA processing enzyme)